MQEKSCWFLVEHIMKVLIADSISLKRSITQLLIGLAIFCRQNLAVAHERV